MAARCPQMERITTSATLIKTSFSCSPCPHWQFNEVLWLDLTSNSILDGNVLLRPFVASARRIKHRLRMTLDRRKLRRQVDTP